jgi:negative regulator of flagellin synthesis FlgM
VKINETGRVGAIQSYKRSGESRAGETSGKKSGRRDEVQISSEAKELQGSSGASRQKINELKQAVSAGTYHVDAMKVAEKLLPYLG